MIQILISSSLLILVLVLLRQLLRNKISRRLQYALWLLVALRLLIPVQFGQSQYSVAKLTQEAQQSKPVQQIQESMREPVVGPSRAELYQQLLDEYLQEGTAPTVAPKPVPQKVQQQLQTQVEERIEAPSVSQILTCIWIGGMVVMAAWFLITNLRFARQAREGALDCDQIQASVPVRICPGVPTPCLVGLFPPVICLTPASTQDPRSLEHVLTHEKTHLRHGDHIWAWVRCLCLCIYWFDPLVWIAAILSKRDCELACDEGALKLLGDGERIPYGKTLLDTVTQSPSPAHILETATAMNETKKQLKERVGCIVKKPRNLLATTVCAILIAAITVGCAFAGSPSDEPTIQVDKPESANPQLLIDLAYEAEQILEEGQIIELDRHWYLTEYIRYNSDLLTNAVTVADDAVVLDKAHIQSDIQLDDGADHIVIQRVDLSDEFLYMIFLDLLLDRYADAVTIRDIHYDVSFDRLYYADLFFYPQYRAAGYGTVTEYYAAIDAGECAMPEYGFYIRYDDASIRWAIDPTRELTEEDVMPPELTEPTDPSRATEPLENTEGPPVQVPAGSAHLFQDPFGCYSMALTSTYATPEQVDIAAFFADGIPGESNEPTDREWELLKDVEGFRKDEYFRRLPKQRMDEMLIHVFGIGLDQMDGVGLDRLTYLEETKCYYFMSSKLEIPQRTFDATADRPDYTEYLDGDGIRHYVNLEAVPNGSVYSYTITSHMAEPTDRLAHTIALAKEKMGSSYVEFLYLSGRVVDKHLTSHCNVSPEIRAQVDADAIAIYERSLYLMEDRLMLRFRYLSLADRGDPMRSPQTVVFDLAQWGLEAIPDLEAVSYRWLFDLQDDQDGAYADSYYMLLQNALFTDPRGFVRALTQRPESQIDMIAQYLPFHLRDDERTLCHALLEALSVDEALSQQEKTTVSRMLRLLEGQTPVPSVPAEITELMDRYAWYRYLGVCCEIEFLAEDMSEHLSQEQREDYYGQQYRICCCDTTDEIIAHARKILGDGLIRELRKERLFTDREGRLYVIVEPTGMVRYRQIEQVDATTFHGGAYDESGYIHTVAFTVDPSGPAPRLLSVEILDPDASLLRVDHYGLGAYLNDRFTVGKDPTDPTTITFGDGRITGTLTYGMLRGLEEDEWTSQKYALRMLESMGPEYRERWLGDHEQRVYYIVLQDGDTTYLRALYVMGNAAWEFKLQCATKEARLAQMIDIITSGFLMV